MNNSEREIYKYVGTKRGSWSPSTIDTVSAKLVTINRLGLEPQRLYSRLMENGYGRYTIQTYFVLARDFEEQTKKTSRIRKWMQDNRLCFKNSYKKKEKRMTEEQFEKPVKSGHNPSSLQLSSPDGKGRPSQKRGP
jgi:hypothetical protein